MEADRYQQNHALFIIGLISLLLCLGVTFFTLFVAPHLIFGWHYDVPEFIAYIREWLFTAFNITDRQASVIIFFGFLLLAIMFGSISYYSSTRIDDQIYEIEEEKNQLNVTHTIKRNRKMSQSTKESLRFFILLFGIAIVVFASTVIFHWLISLY